MYLLKVLLLISILYSCQSDVNIETLINSSQEFSINKVTTLSSAIKETSGLINFNGRIITHNDSGGKASLYEIDISTGNIIRTVTLINVNNKDMEDIAQDENYIYLCDIGNNSNKRKDQTIYKISKSDYLSKEEVHAEKIMISYQSTNYDAEAVVNVNNNLFLFTKNWGDLKTSVYKVPKDKGNYKLVKIDDFKINGLITGADYNKNTNTILLTGYSDFRPFVVLLNNFSQYNPLDGKVEKKVINVSGSTQIEGVSANPDNSYYLSAEESLGSPAILYELNMKN